MSEEAKYQHPVDYAMHPKGGIVLMVWGLLIALGEFHRHGLALPLRGISPAAAGIGFALLGIAIRQPAGPLRRWLVRAWLLGLAVSVGVLVWAGAVGAEP
jgi:hypothetical protein